MAKNIHPEVLKVYNSDTYRRRIKRIIETTKLAKGVWTKVPRRVKLPDVGRPLSDKELSDFRKENTFKLDKECLHYFAQPLYFGRENND